VTTTTISPFVVGGIEEVELSDGKGGKKKSWRKEILPSGTRKYKGQNLDFSKINPACVQAFDDKAVDAVPFVLALSDNKHPETGEELKTLEGDLTKLEMGKDGSLFGYFDLSDTVVQTINKSNKKLGVSARIDINYEREDTGKKYPFALRHVCATTAAHIKGMKPWEVVELSEVDKKQYTVDLSTEVIESETETKETGDDLVAVEIPKDQLDKLLGFLADMEKGEEVANKLGNEGDTPPAPAQLSEEASKRIELAETNAKKAYEFAERTMSNAAKRDWAVTRKELASEGVPPVMLDFAEPIMELHRRPSIKLSETETLDAGDVIAKILDAAKGTIKLNEESGHSVGASGPGELDDDKEFQNFMASFIPQDTK
jgi:hypothetical protein